MKKKKYQTKINNCCRKHNFRNNKYQTQILNSNKYKLKMNYTKNKKIKKNHLSILKKFRINQNCKFLTILSQA